MQKIIKTISFFIFLQQTMYADTKVETDYVEQGKAYFKKGFYQLTPKNRQAEAAQQYIQAVQKFKQAIAVNPDDEAAYRHLARVYAVHKKPEKAAAAYQKVIELNPWDVDTYVFAALALFESQQYEKAIKILQTAKDYTTDNAVRLKIDNYIEKIEAYYHSKDISDVK